MLIDKNKKSVNPLRAKTTFIRKTEDGSYPCKNVSNDYSIRRERTNKSIVTEMK